GEALGKTGAWHEAVVSIDRGLAFIEGPRQQLSSSAARAQAFVTEASLYRSALETLLAASTAGDDGAGAVAMRLVESVHRNALAQLLRSGPLSLSSEVLAIIEKVHEL